MRLIITGLVVLWASYCHTAPVVEDAVALETQVKDIIPVSKLMNMLWLQYAAESWQATIVGVQKLPEFTEWVEDRLLPFMNNLRDHIATVSSLMYEVTAALGNASQNRDASTVDRLRRLAQFLDREYAFIAIINKNMRFLMHGKIVQGMHILRHCPMDNQPLRGFLHKLMLLTIRFSVVAQALSNYPHVAMKENIRLNVLGNQPTDFHTSLLHHISVYAEMFAGGPARDVATFVPGDASGCASASLQPFTAGDKAIDAAGPWKMCGFFSVPPPMVPHDSGCQGDLYHSIQYHSDPVPAHSGGYRGDAVGTSGPANFGGFSLGYSYHDYTRQ
ncbi:hypothetical protein SeMB42_g07055 [Synchytrium endobioticum]|uniref:Uncharacterized protein n=1 Tax=Synchytrium endobioticum TaxID=286115 RepID=A0A507CFR6_9FUNG|nr:hypothetical protein SeMB42_g07055 [Synchytrium endobioticum]TPX41577.1 hypothetical protein SeLEV6574_g06018 [Synchytrium endobioticum]